MRRISTLWIICIVVLSALAWVRCAHPVSPTGGPKDTTPPVFVKSVPEIYTVRFKEKKITIDFNEYIVLKNASKEIFTSPPMVVKPEYTVRGRSLVVEFQEELREDATYVIYFGNAITDLTEGNALKGFSYVFSTGDAVDSMMLAGKVMSAFDLKPAENVVVSVYAAGQDTMPLDSMPLKVPPLSAIRTGADGTFTLSNLPDRDFLLFALEDLNNNFFFDLPDEKIGFLDSLVRPEHVPLAGDTALSDSSGGVSAVTAAKPEKHYEILLFQQPDSTQRFLSAAFTAAGSIQLAYKLPPEGLSIRPLNFNSDTAWYLEEHNLPGDTLTLWPLEKERDTFRLLLELPSVMPDTVKVVRKKADGGSSRRKTVGVKNLEFRSSFRAGVLEPEKDLVLTFSEPVIGFDLSLFNLASNGDTVPVTAHFTDSIQRRLIVPYIWEENRSYGLLIPDSVLTGLSGSMNSAISLNFRTKPLSDYGILMMDYFKQEDAPQYILELLGEKDLLVRRDTLSESRQITYGHLKPGSYRIKAIHDRNQNGRWDSGNYRRGQLPERVTYLDKEITIRSNWEFQEEWKLLP